MSTLVFLLIPVIVVVLGTLIVLLRSREPTGYDHTIKRFQREMKALAKDGERTVDTDRIDPKPVASDPSSDGE
jgi:hypothetical protein